MCLINVIDGVAFALDSHYSLSTVSPLVPGYLLSAGCVNHPPALMSIY